MLDDAKLMGVLIGIFVIVGVCVAISIGGTAITKANMSKALTKGGIFFIAIAVLGLTGVGVGLVTFGRQILVWLGVNIPAG